MKKTGIPLIIVALLLMVLPAYPVETAHTARTWTSSNGESIEATYVKTLYADVVLEREGGQQFKIGYKQLKKADQDYLVAEGLINPQNPYAPPLPKAAAGTHSAAEAKPALAGLFGDSLYDAKKKKVSVSELSDKKKIGIYFSAHWCPPCRTFTPELVKAYNKMQENGDSFELVFVSSDRSKNDMFNYMKDEKMPWLVVKHESKEANALKKKYDVRGIPSLVIIDNEGETLTKNARGDVSSLGAKAYSRW